MLRARGPMRALLVCCGLFTVLSGCAVIESPLAPPPSIGLDEKVFRCSVEPVLVRQCSYTACHGIAGSPLRIYSPGKLRAVRPASIDAAIAPLTDAERHANFLSASGFRFGVEDPADNLLVRKPLAPVEGGYTHEGGAIFASTGDTQWMTIEAWLVGTGKCP